MNIMENESLWTGADLRSLSNTAVKCVVFDMDGTIADTRALRVGAFCRAVLELSGERLSERQLTKLLELPEDRIFRTLFLNRCEEGKALYYKYYEELHPVLCPEPFHGIPTLFFYLRKNGIKLALVTEKSEEQLAVSMRMFGMDGGWFDAVKTGDADGFCKSEGIQSILSTLAVPPAEALFVGDSISDIEAAREIKVPVISAAWAGTPEGKLLRKHNPDRVFDTVSSLNKWFKTSLWNYRAGWHLLSSSD